MKKSHLIFCLFAAAITFAVIFSNCMVTVADRIVLSRAEFWRLGFGPVAAALALVLAVASVAAYRGSRLALQIVALWLAMVSICFFVLLRWHFHSVWSQSMTSLSLSSMIWYFVTLHKTSNSASAFR